MLFQGNGPTDLLQRKLGLTPGQPRPARGTNPDHSRRTTVVPDEPQTVGSPRRIGRRLRFHRPGAEGDVETAAMKGGDAAARTGQGDGRGRSGTPAVGCTTSQQRDEYWCSSELLRAWTRRARGRECTCVATARQNLPVQRRIAGRTKPRADRRGTEQEALTIQSERAATGTGWSSACHQPSAAHRRAGNQDRHRSGARLTPCGARRV